LPGPCNHGDSIGIELRLIEMQVRIEQLDRLGGQRIGHRAAIQGQRFEFRRERARAASSSNISRWARSLPRISSAKARAWDAWANQATQVSIAGNIQPLVAYEFLNQEFQRQEVQVGEFHGKSPSSMVPRWSMTNSTTRRQSRSRSATI